MSSEAFQKAVDFILPHEEDFARGHWGDERFVVAENVSGDSGGWTKYGIDQSSHPALDVQNLTRDGAIAIYDQEWEQHRLDELPEKLAICCFDVWVNGGYAVKWLQGAINFANKDHALIVDGALGPATIAAAQRCDQAAVFADFINERNQRFEALAQNGDAKFLSGWLQRDKDLEAYLTEMA